MSATPLRDDVLALAAPPVVESPAPSTAPPPVAPPTPSVPPAPAADTRAVHVDVLRALATVAVVLLHTAAVQWYRLPVTSSAWRQVTALDAATRWCVPVFFMLTGALFLGRPRAVSPGRLLRHNLPRLAAAWLLWSFAYGAFDAWHRHQPLTGRGIVDRLPTAYYHLWFLPAVIGVYLALPLLWHICRSREAARWMVGLAAVLVLVPSLPADEGAVVRTAEAIAPSTAAGWPVFAVLGHLAMTTRRRLPSWLLVGALAASVWATHLLTVHHSLAAGRGRTEWFAYLTPQVAAGALALFLLVRNLEPLLRRAGGIPVWRWLGDHSFGVYLVHPALLTLWSDADHVTGVPGALLALAVVLPASYALSWLLSRIPVVRQVV